MYLLFINKTKYKKRREGKGKVSINTSTELSLWLVDITSKPERSTKLEDRRTSVNYERV